MQLRGLLTLFTGILIGSSAGSAAMLGAAGILDLTAVVHAAFSNDAVFTPASRGRELPKSHSKTLDGGRCPIEPVSGSKPVLVNFWATWCPPCRDEMPLLQAAADRYSRNLSVIGVNFDEPEG